MTTTEFVQGTPEWVEARMFGIGSSDAPVIAGESPYRSLYELWAEKTGRLVPVIDDATARLFRIGHMMEPVLLDLYSQETDREVRRVRRMLRAKHEPYLFASLDGRVVGERRIVECKWTNARRWTAEEVPGDVQVQVQHAMYVAEAEVADVVALVGADLRIVEVPRDPDLIRDLLAMERRFWEVNCRDGVEPVVDGSESARRTLQSLHPREETPLEPAPREVELIAAQLFRAKDIAKSLLAEIDAHENALRYLIGEREGFEAEGFRVTWKRSKDSDKIGWQEVATAYRRILSEMDSPPAFETIEGLYTVTTPGPRVLRVTDRRNRG